MERDKALIQPAHKRFACMQEIAGVRVGGRLLRRWAVFAIGALDGTRNLHT